MLYKSNEEIKLGDTVSARIGAGVVKAKVAMLGSNQKHLDLEKDFLDWVQKEKLVDEDSIVIECLDKHPYAHSDPNFAPVGKYVFMCIDEELKLIERN